MIFSEEVTSSKFIFTKFSPENNYFLSSSSSSSLVIIDVGDGEVCMEYLIHEVAVAELKDRWTSYYLSNMQTKKRKSVYHFIFSNNKLLLCFQCFFSFRSFTTDPSVSLIILVFELCRFCTWWWWFQQRSSSLLIIVLPLSSICKIEVTFISAALRPQLNFRRRRLECNDIVFPICRGRRKKSHWSNHSFFSTFTSFFS